jgi:hypothetical protein
LLYYYYYYYYYYSTNSGVSAGGVQGVAVTDLERKQVEEMLNIGHSVAAAVYVIWHVSHDVHISIIMILLLLLVVVVLL